MPQPYRIAIIGVGAIATMHARAIQDLAGRVELVAANCRTKDKGEKFAKEWNCRWFSDYEAMLDDAKPDLVSICTPSGAHLEPTQACAKRGIHVLCEKPLEINVERIDRMIEAAREGGIQLGGIFPQRYNPVVGVLRDAIARGRFGTLAVISVAVPWWRDDAYYAPERWQGTAALDGGGAMMNQSIHSIDLLQWLGAAASPDIDAQAGPLEEVFCYTAKRGHDESLIEVEDTATAVGRFRDGTLAQILAATSMYPGTLKEVTVAGRDGTVRIVEDTLTEWSFRNEFDEDKAIREKYGAKTAHGGGASDPMAINHGLHTANLKDFLDALDSGVKPAIDAHEARKAVAIIQACYESMQKNAPVAPPAATVSV